MYRTKTKDGDVSDEYWTNQEYWTEIATEDNLLDFYNRNLAEHKSYNYTKNDYVNSLIKEIHIIGEFNPELKYFVRSCLRLGRDNITNGDAAKQGVYFAIQSYNPADETRQTVCCLNY